jgi:hypothetical protein
MCEYCHTEYCCVHGRHHYYPRAVYAERPPVYYYDRPEPETRREYLEDEKKLLERRLKELDERLAEVAEVSK